MMANACKLQFRFEYWKLRWSCIGNLTMLEVDGATRLEDILHWASWGLRLCIARSGLTCSVGSWFYFFHSTGTGRYSKGVSVRLLGFRRQRGVELQP